MKEDMRKIVASELIKVAEMLGDFEGTESTEADPAFVEKLREVRQQMTRLAPRKNKKLRQFGIGLIRPSDTVEDLVNVLSTILAN